MKKTPTYIFLDEAGNLDFSSNGTRFFVLGALVMHRPSGLYADLAQLKYELIERGINIEYFHAAEDSQIVRDRVFQVIQRNLKDMRFDTLIVEKRKRSCTSTRGKILPTNARLSIAVRDRARDQGRA